MAKKKGARQKIEESPTTKTKIEPDDVANTKQAIVLDKARRHLDNKYDFMFNTFGNEIEFKKKEDKEYEEFSERVLSNIIIELDYKGLHLADYKFRQLLSSVYISQEYNPVTDYIYSLRKWNGKTDYIKTFLDQAYLTNEADREYVLNGFKKWFVAFVMSFIEDKPEPYFINQVAFIVLGKKQGIYKSSWLGSIIPEKLRLKYYYPNSFNAHNKDHLKYLATRMLINLDEMESYNKTDIGVMKHIISTAQISLRLPYARAEENMKRRASFCGSINNRQFLRDETGSRRWFVVEVDGINYDMKFNVNGMYSQALELYRSGFQYWFDGSDIAEMNKRNEEFTEIPFVEEQLLKLYDNPDANDPDAIILPTSDIASGIAKENERMNVNDSVLRTLGRALNKHGYKRVSFRRKNSKTAIYGWRVKPVVFGIPNLDENSENEII